MRAKGKAPDHKQQVREDGLPEIHMDYCFLSSEGSRLHTVLVARERNSRMTLSSIVPHKGASEEWVIRRMLAFVGELGIGEFLSGFQVRSGECYYGCQE